MFSDEILVGVKGVLSTAFSIYLNYIGARIGRWAKESLL